MSSAACTPPRSAAGSPRAGLYGVVVIVTACVLVPALAALMSSPAVDGWYAGVPKPAWAALYATMAVAASIVWLARDSDDVCCPLTAFGVQLALNLVWCVCFFGLKSALLGFLDVCLLWVMAAVTTAEFFLVSRTAGWLMVPYWVWVSYAAAINGAILLLGG